jgi:hypothetical protein
MLALRSASRRYRAGPLAEAISPYCEIAPFGGQEPQLGGDVAALVVDRGIAADIFQVAAFRRPAGDTDNPCAANFRQLAGDAAHRAGGGGYGHGVTGLYFAQQQHAGVGGQAGGHAQQAQVAAGGYLGVVDFPVVLTGLDGVTLRPHAADDLVARAQALIAALQYPARTQGHHRCVHLAPAVPAVVVQRGGNKGIYADVLDLD